MPIDRGAKTDIRQRRALQQISALGNGDGITINLNSAGNLQVNPIAPLAKGITGLELTLLATGGLIVSSSSLALKLDSTPGLVLGAGGVKLLLDPTEPGLQLTSGLKVLLASNPGLEFSTGLKAKVTSPIALGGSGIGLTLASGGGLEDSSGLKISNNAVTTLRIADSAVTIAKLAPAVPVDGMTLTALAAGTGGFAWSAAPGVTLAANGGLEDVAGLKIKLDATPALVLGAGGVKVLLDPTEAGLQATNGMKLLLASNPGLELSSGLKSKVVSPIALGASGIGLTLAATPGLVDASGLKVLLDNTEPGLQLTSGLKVLLASNPGLEFSSGLRAKVASPISLGGSGIGLSLASGGGLEDASGLKISNNAVTTLRIADSAITIAKLAPAVPADGFVLTALAAGTGGFAWSAAPGVTLATNGGLEDVAGLKIKLDSTPGLVLGAGGVKVLLDPTEPGLQLNSGAKVLLGATPGLELSSGLKAKVVSPIALGASGIGLTLAATPGLVDASGLKVLVDPTEPGLQLTNGLKVLLASNSGLEFSSGLKVVGLSTVSRNFVDNGGMNVWQRGISRSTTAAGVEYTADRWALQTLTTGARHTWSKETVSVPVGSGSCLKLVVQTADNDVAALDLTVLRQAIEGIQMSCLPSQQITLTFWVRSSLIGIYSVAFSSYAGLRSYIVEYTINVANTWEKKTISLTMDAAGTAWLLGAGELGITINFALMCGATLAIAPTNAWVDGNYLASTNQSNWNATVGNTFYLGQVQLELASAPTSFEFLRFDDDFRRCCRYFAKGGYDVEIAPGSAGIDRSAAMAIGHGTNTIVCFERFPVWLCKDPLIQLYGYDGTVGKVCAYGGSGNLGSTLTVSRYGKNGIVTINDSGTPFVAGDRYWFGYSAHADFF